MEQKKTNQQSTAQRYRAAVIFLLVLLVGFGIFFAASNLWAWHNYRKAKEAIESGDYEKAESCLDSCILFWSGHAEAHFLMARTARCLKKYEKAKEHLEKAENLIWSPAAVELEEILCRAQQGEFQEVEGYLHYFASQETEDTAAVLEVLAQEYAANGQLVQGRYWGERFLKFAPKNVAALLVVGWIHQINNDAFRCLNHYRKAVEVQPDNNHARITLAAALVEFGRHQEALEEYQELHSRGVRAKPVLLGLAQCYRVLGEAERAREILAKLVVQEPGEWDIWSELGVLEYQERHLDKAEKCLKKAVALYSHAAPTLYRLYLCLRQQGKSKRGEAEKAHAKYKQLVKNLDRLGGLFMKARSKDPKDPAIAYEIGDLLMRTGAVKMGAYWMYKTLQLAPTHPKAREALAVYYEKIGKRELAASYKTAHP